jgi:hypothetical protein
MKFLFLLAISMLLTFSVKAQPADDAETAAQDAVLEKYAFNQNDYFAQCNVIEFSRLSQTEIFKCRVFKRKKRNPSKGKLVTTQFIMGTYYYHEQTSEKIYRWD